MKKGLFFSFLMVLLCNIQSFSQDYKLYKDPAGFSFNCPSTWTKIKDSSISCGFMSPKGPKDAHADALFSLDISPTSVETPKPVMDKYEKVCFGEFKDYKKLKRGTQKLGTHDCAVLYFEGTPRDAKLTIMICIFVENNSEYVFTCSSKPALSKQNFAIFDKMIGSFKTED